MSNTRVSPGTGRINPATVFAALGDPMRLSLVGKLSVAPRLSISRLTEGSALTRQAITKHLRVLENAGVVAVRTVRPRKPVPAGAGTIAQSRAYLEGVSRQWDDALARLKAFVEA